MSNDHEQASGQIEDPPLSGTQGHRKPQADDARKCAVCGQRRRRGEELKTSTQGPGPVWVCTNCQQKLSRGVDDQGVKGG